jgi:hypothetical protein
MTGPVLYLALLAAGTVTAVVLGQCGHRLDLARARHTAEFMRLTVALPPERYELTEETPMFPIGRRHPGMVVPVAEPAVPPWVEVVPPVQGCQPPSWYVAPLDRGPRRTVVLREVTAEFRSIVAASYPATPSLVESR